MFIEINGVPYVVAQGADLEWSYAQQLSTPFRLSGVPTPQDNQLISRLKLDWVKGLGQHTQHRETGQHVGTVRNSTLETRWEVLALAKRRQTTTENGSGVAEFMRAFTHQGSDLWACFERTNNGSSRSTISVMKYVSSGDTWDEGDEDVAPIGDFPSDNADTKRVFDLVTHKGLIFVGYGVDDDSASTERYYLKSSPDGATWTIRSTVGAAPWVDDIIDDATFSGTNDFGRVHMMSMLDFGDDLVIAVYEHPDAANGATSQIRVYHSSNADAASPTWTSIGTVGTGREGAVLVQWQDFSVSGFPAIPVLVTREAIWKVDISGTALTQIRVLPGATNDGLAATVGRNGNLYVSLDDGNNLEFSITDIGTFNERNIGPATRGGGLLGDGLVSARQGHANAMYGGDTEWLFVSYGGHAANKNASIFAYHYETSTWHHITQNATANEDIGPLIISTQDDGVARLHFATEAVDDFNMIEEINSPPTSDASILYEDSGTVDFAEDDMGDPLTLAGVFQTKIDADGLTAGTANEYIDYSTGSDSNTWGTDDRGDFNSTTKFQQFASGEGVSANQMKHRLVLHNGSTNTNTPKVKNLEVQAVNLQATLRQPTIPIDLTKTFETFHREVETQIQEIEAVAKLATQQLVSIGKFADFRATITIPPSVSMTLKSGDEQQEEGVVGGVMVIRVNQLLEGV